MIAQLNGLTIGHRYGTSMQETASVYDLVHC